MQPNNKFTSKHKSNCGIELKKDPDFSTKLFIRSGSASITPKRKSESSQNFKLTIKRLTLKPHSEM